MIDMKYGKHYEWKHKQNVDIQKISWFNINCIIVDLFQKF